MSVINKIKEKFAKTKMQKGSRRQRVFSNSLKAYFTLSSELKRIEDEKNKLNNYLKSLREEKRNITQSVPKEQRERYSDEVESSITGIRDALQDLKEKEKKYKKKQKELSKLIEAAKKGKKTRVSLEGEKLEYDFS